MFEDYIFTYKKLFCAIHEEYNLKIADQSDLVKPDTGFATVMQWRIVIEHFLGFLLLVLTVCKYSHQNSIVENMAFSYDTVVPVKT